MSYEEFRKSRAKKITIWAVASLVLLLVSVVLALSSGNGKLNLVMISHLFSDSKESMILYSIRIPRTLAALLGGALLGVSGCVMQGVLRNPLASPYTVGVAQAAAFGASFAIIILGALEGGSFGSLGVVGSAFISSAICMGAILFIGTKLSGSEPSSLILAGVALGALFSAMTMMLQFFASDLNAAAALFWTFGDLGKATYQNLSILFISFAISFVVLWRGHWKMDALSFGDEGARAKGVDVGKFRVIMLIVSTFGSAVVVSFFGIIGFVGLVAPHLVRLSIGQSYGVLVPFSAIFGAVLLVLADTVSKFIIPPVIIPIGIVTSFMGVPIFIYLLARKKNGS
ncbi:MAG: iron ABC transporter permease [Campylobacteraceae bacterium]|nr:iron ABC transporter permease [Campylobacteraceae bacterium]